MRAVYGSIVTALAPLDLKSPAFDVRNDLRVIRSAAGKVHGTWIKC
jgi:hypothetical protein